MTIADIQVNHIVIEYVNPQSLRPHPRNSEIYGEESIRELREQIVASKWIKPLVITSNNVIISGHRRWQTALDLRWDVPVERRHFANETDELEALLLENLFRHKTTSQKGREAKAWKGIIAERNKQKQLAQGDLGYRGKERGSEGGRGRKKETPLPACAGKGVSRRRGKRASDTSDQVASLVGLGSGDSLERVETVIEVADQLQPVLAQTLISLVDEPKGISPAARVAQMEPEKRDTVLELLATGQAKTVKGAELEIHKAEIEAQAQLAPTKPLVTLGSWETWLSNQGQCDLLITDPPYATDIEDIEAFAQSWLPVALAKVKKTGRAYVCIGAYPRELRAYLNVSACLPVQQVLVWSYKNTLGPSPEFDYKQNWQAILYFRGPNAPDLDCPIMKEQFSAQEINAPDGRQGNRYHTWQKPDDLAERLIRHSTKQGDTVFDCFAGTGTFLLAAHRLGRVAFGCEVNPEMLETARSRGCEVRDEE